MIPWTRTIWTLSCAIAFLSGAARAHAEDAGVVYDGFDGPGKGKHIVFVTGDEEYRSEESMPQLAKILAKHYGFQCTVLFAIDKKTGTINPSQLDNIPGLEALRTADLMVIFTRWRRPPRRPDEVYRGLRQLGQTNPRPAHRVACVQFQDEQDLL